MEVSGGRKEKKSSDNQTTGILCDPCERVNEEENAAFYCTECNEFLCHADAKAHRKAAMLKSHHLLDRNSMPRQKIGSYEDNMCQFHDGKILEYYCNSHTTNCCSLCATNEHKHCDVVYIDDIAKGYEHSSEYKSLVKDMTNLTQRLQSVKQQSVENKSNAQCNHTEIVSEIRKFRAEINSILDSLENASLKEAKVALHLDSDATEPTMRNCDTLMAKLQDMTSSMEKLRKYKQERQLVMQSKKARTQVKDIEDTLSKVSADNRRNDYKFIPDDTIPQLLRSLKSLGRIGIKERSTKPKVNDQRANEVSCADVSVPVVKQPVTASRVSDINIQHSRDKKSSCFITGGVVLGQNKIALTDYVNASVKVVDVISKTVTSCIRLPPGPWGITRVEQDQVVVSCYGGKLVFLKVGNTLSIVNQLNIGGDIWGIAYTNNTLLVVFQFPDWCVKVMDLRGNTLKTFKTDADRNNLFTNLSCIALSENRNTIFVSDTVYDRVTSLRMDGTVRGVYTDDNLRCPFGLAVDRNDNVYVAGNASHNIHQLSRECKPIRVLLDYTHGIEYPWMMTYCKAEHKLYIGSHTGSKGNFITVFQLH